MTPKSTILSGQIPKYGTLIPNRVFVGGISSDVSMFEKYLILCWLLCAFPFDELISFQEQCQIGFGVMMLLTFEAFLLHFYCSVMALYNQIWLMTARKLSNLCDARCSYISKSLRHTVLIENNDHDCCDDWKSVTLRVWSLLLNWFPLLSGYGWPSANGSVH